MMSSQTSDMKFPTSTDNSVGFDHDSRVIPITSFHATFIISLVFGTFMGVATGVVGVITNSANICVYLKLGLTETTNISYIIYL